MTHTRLRAAIAQEVDARQIMSRVLEASLVLLRHADGAATELDDGRGHMVYVCARGTLADHVGLKLTLDGSLSGQAVRDRTVLLCNDSETDARVDRDACRRVGARSMLCVPLDRGDGRVTGVLKVTSREPAAFRDADVTVLETLAPFVAAAVGGATDVVRATRRLLGAPSPDVTPLTPSPVEEFIAHVLGPDIADSVAARERIDEVLASGSIPMEFQPIVDVSTECVVGFEALARFTGDPKRTPDCWFADAHGLGLGVELELLAMQSALAGLGKLPAGVYLAVNAGPDVIADARLQELTRTVDGERLVIELTEHVAVEDYPNLLSALTTIRKRGTRIAVDDTGAGISSFSHILRLAPDIIKLDRFLTSGIDRDPIRRSLGAALASFASSTGAEVVAEGVESRGELKTLRGLNITRAQGWYLGRPKPLEELLAEQHGRALLATH